MSDVHPLSHEESIVVDAPPEAVYDLVSDVTRTGEWSPICQECWWDDPATAGQVGSHFTGRNVLPHRTWETRSEVVVAESGREFAWQVAGGWVRWGYTLAPAETGTLLTETWHFLPAGIAGFQKKYGDAAQSEIAARSEAALSGIPVTLAAIKRIAEAAS